MAKDPIFSNAETMTKGEILPFIISKLEDFGWENISSNMTDNTSSGTSNYVDITDTPDYAIMYSKGEDEDKNIFVRLTPWCGSGGYSCISYSGSHMELSLWENYIPSELEKTNGVSTPTRTGGVRKAVPLQNINSRASIVNTTPGFTVRVGASLDHFAVTIRPPASVEKGPVIFGAGIYYSTFNSYMDGRDTMVWSNYLRQQGTSSTLTLEAANTIYLYRQPEILGITKNVACVAQLVTVTPKQPNFEGSYALSDILFGTTSWGPVGTIPIVKAVQDSDPMLFDKTRLIVGEKVYEVLVNTDTTYTQTLPAKMLAVRIQ
jgi:hypothetical protein